MRSLLVAALFTSVFLAGCVNVNAERASVQACQPKREAQVLRHIVLFKFKADTPQEKIKEIESAFCALPGKIDAIHDFEWGTDVSAENLADGFTHCFLVTFRSEEDRGTYLPHPAHKDFADSLGPYLDKVLVMDYWTKE